MNHWYDNEISQGILREKYYHKGETNPEQFMWYDSTRKTE